MLFVTNYSSANLQSELNLVIIISTCDVLLDD